jgi:hypothetical protein
MSAASRRATLAAARDAKMKKVALVGGVVLLGVVGFQAPKIMHHGSSSTSSADTAAATAAGTTAATTTQAPLVTAYADDVPPAPGSGQLVSFELFRSHDPFIQQLSEETAPTRTTSPPPPPSPPATTAPSIVPVAAPPATAPPPLAPEPTAPATTASSEPEEPTPSVPVVTPATTPPPTTPPPAPTSVAIAVNGACEVVAAKATFPAAGPLFQLVSIGSDGASVQIGVAGGSLESGAPSATLSKTKPLTLVNTADGVRYKLELADACADSPPPATTAPPATTSP